jgi:hypothetical protein
MASIAILRSSQHQLRLADAQRSSTQGKAIADGLYHRAIATLRDNPKAQGTILDPEIKTPGPRAELRRISKDATLIQVFLYQKSTVPAISTTIDPEVLSGGGKGKGKGKDKNKDKDKGKGKGKGKDKGK